MDSLDKRFPRYSKLLYLYPSAYRKEYSEQMLQTLADMLDDPEHNHIAVWVRIIIDFPFSVLTQQVMYTGETLAKNTPVYIKRTTLLGAWLVAPFFILVILDSLLHNRLQHSWVWHTPALFIWLVLLPSIAAALCVAALLRWTHTRRRETHKSSWKALADIRSNWPLLGIIIIAIGIIGLTFFHDSTHCVTGNPIRELHNPHDTLQCIEQR